MNRHRKSEVRGKSMLGTVLFALGIIGTVLSVITPSVWTGVAGVALLVHGIIMLYQVGKSLP
jgi:membrane-bound ClpP family serine protease